MVSITFSKKKQLSSNPDRLQVQTGPVWWLVNVIMINQFVSNSVTTWHWLLVNDKIVSVQSIDLKPEI